MAALNIAETEALRAAVYTMYIVEGRIRNGESLNEAHADILKKAREHVNTVVQMKGHYFK